MSTTVQVRCVFTGATSLPGARTTWCGKREADVGWAFRDAAQAALSPLADVLICRRCSELIRGRIAAGTEPQA